MRFRLMAIGLLFQVFCVLSVFAQCKNIDPDNHHPCVVISSPRESRGDSGDGTGGRRDRDGPADRARTSDSSSSGGNGSPVGAGDPRDRLLTNAAQRERQALLNSMSRSGGLTSMITANNGYLPLSVTRILKPSSSKLSMSTVYFSRPPGLAGHHYFAFNYLGDNLDMAATWRVVTNSFPDVFPASRVVGPSGPIALGNRYDLVMEGSYTPAFTFPVVVSSVTAYAFTLTAQPDHWLKGSVTHGIVRDIDGTVWLFEEGSGIPNELPSLQAVNYDIADAMWSRLATNVKSKLRR
jgi:hypothetical protein